MKSGIWCLLLLAYMSIWPNVFEAKWWKCLKWLTWERIGEMKWLQNGHQTYDFWRHLQIDSGAEQEERKKERERERKKWRKKERWLNGCGDVSPRQDYRDCPYIFCPWVQGHCYLIIFHTNQTLQIKVCAYFKLQSNLTCFSISICSLWNIRIASVIAMCSWIVLEHFPALQMCYTALARLCTCFAKTGTQRADEVYVKAGRV